MYVFLFNHPLIGPKLTTSPPAWRLANISYPEDKYRDFDSDLFGGRVDMYWRETCFCWCLWSLDIPVQDLQQSDAILVRAMDEALNIQPRDMYWSVLGMMNNPWFRIAIVKDEDGDVLRFEHPTQPALMPGGWMERVKKIGGDLANGQWGEQPEGEVASRSKDEKEEIQMKREGVTRIIDIEELKRHTTTQEPWFVVNGEVYDGTKFLEGHPGGAQSIISAAGTDASEEFLAIRKSVLKSISETFNSDNGYADSETAKAMMPEYHIGTLDPLSMEILKNRTTSQDDEQISKTGETFLQPRAWKKAQLCSKISVSWDTRLFTFKLDHDNQILGLPTGQHLMLKLKDSSSNESIIRPYTPISETDQKATVDLLVKVYFDTPACKGGKMTMALDKIDIGSTVEFKGPIGKLTYLGKGRVRLNQNEKQVRSFRMICGGSGITPIFQVLRAVMQDPEDRTSCVVLEGNRLEEDILCRAELDAFAAAEDPSKCTIVHTLTKPSSQWTGRRGRISEELLKEYARPQEGSLALICGPEGMEKSVREILLALGWNESDLVFF
jgi:nitrate reductase (NAD(P)H)